MEDPVQSENKGTRFCRECLNMMKPVEIASEERLGYMCPRCKTREHAISDPFATVRAEDHLVAKREFSAAQAADIINPDFIYDPAFPRVKRTCPRCQYGDAVYQLSNDDNQNKLMLIYYCAREQPRCGNRWYSGSDEDFKYNDKALRRV
eukprot:TRINITY_DN0_c1334_g1_i1.p1 TRINITY_DN0_c1334_g1~~TRINITY_DN0_c1334_g1_i1.p1  ORF type:complete len:149 (-),score=21.77 TRINITY_DN0_c1334_g1_i1:99-545(-)